MEIVFSLNPKLKPDVVGEILRDVFFIQDLEERKFGCYSSFELHSDVKSLPDESIDEMFDDEDIRYKCFEKNLKDGTRVVMKYYWFGDGTLEFHFDDGSFLDNSDCKKSYGWVFYSSEEE